MSTISSSTAAYYNSLGAGGASNWLAGAITSIRNQASQGGMMGALQSASQGGSLSASQAANAFASISDLSMQSRSRFAAQIGTANLQEQAQKKLQAKLKDLSDSTNGVQAQNVLDPFIYFSDGAYIDTNSNILTMSDGTKIDTVTGLPYVDPASIIQMANGAYLDTKNNILTMSDGTKIDTVTGLKVSTTA